MSYSASIRLHFSFTYVFSDVVSMGIYKQSSSTWKYIVDD